MEKLGGESENREVFKKDQVISEYLLPAIQSVIETSKGKTDEYEPDFYALEFDNEENGIQTKISFETDDPGDEKYYVDIDINHTQSDAIINLPQKEMEQVMEKLKNNLSTSNAKESYKLGRMIREGDIDSLTLHRYISVDIGYSIDMSIEGIEIAKTKVYKTMVENVEIERITIGVEEEETPIGLRRIEIFADDEDYKTIALACQLVREQAARG